MMRSANYLGLGLCGLIGILCGCGLKKDANSELQKAAAVMAQPEPAQAAAAAEPVQQTPSAPAATPAKTQAQEMSQAMAAYKSGDLEDAVTKFQKLRATPVMSAEKRMALNDAMAAVMGEIYALAAKGDARAIQAVKKYEEMQTQRR
jgi:hypothetical protein